MQSHIVRVSKRIKQNTDTCGRRLAFFHTAVSLSALLLGYVASTTSAYAVCTDLAGATVAPTFTCTGANGALNFQTSTTTHNDPGDTFTGNLTLTLGNSATATSIFADLTDGANLNITTNAASSVISAGTGINGAVTGNGTINVTTSGTVTGNGLYGVRTQAVDGASSININSGSTVTGAVHGISAQTNNGVVTITNAGTISGGIQTQSTGSGNITIANTGTINNGIHNTSTGTGSLTINNNANGTINGRIWRDFAASVINFNNTDATSTWNVSGGVSTVNVVANSGTVTIANGSSLSVDTTFTNNAGAVLNNNGTFTFGTSLSNAGTINGSITNSTILTNSGTMNGSVTNTATGILTTTGTLNSALTNSGTVNAQGTVDGAVSNDGTFNVSGLLNGGAAFTNNAAGVLNVSLGNYLMAGSNLANSGTVNISATRTLSVNAFTNNAGAILTSSGILTTATGLSNSGTVNAQGAINGTISNGGIFNVSGLLNGDSAFTNNGTGTLNVSLGNYLMAGSNLANSGTVNISAGRTLSVNAFTNNAGAILTSSGILTTATGLSNSGTVNAQGAINGTISNGGIFNVSGLLNGDSAFTNNGTGTLNVSLGNYLMAGSNLANSGTVNISATRTLSVNAFTNNAGAVLNNNGTLNFVSSLMNAGTINGAITNAATTTNSGVMNGSVINTSTGTLTTTGTINNTLTNSGTVNAQGTITGAVVQNAGTFNVTGLLTGTPSFTNNGGTLNVSGGNFTGLTTLLNRSTINVSGAPSRLLSASTITNDTNGTITNNGTLTATDAFTNNGILTSRGALNAGTNFTNNGTFNAQGDVTSPLINNNGSLNATGALRFVSTTFNNNVGGQVLLQNNSSLTTGDYNNAGLTTLSRGSSLNVNGTLNNTGTINLLNGVPNNAVNVTGGYTGNGVFSVDVDFNNGRADRLNAQGGSGRTLLVINPIGTPNFKSDILIVSGAGGATFESVINLPSNGSPSPFGSSGGQVVHASGLFQQWFGQAANGEFVIRSDVNPVAVSSLSGSISSLLASVSTFQEPSSAFIGAPVNPDPNTFSIGTWGRGRAGSFDIKTSSLVSSPFGVDRQLSHNAATQVSGMQLGIDAGFYNINNTGWSVNLGTLGGLVEGKSKSSAGDSIELSQPFGGVYSVVSNGAFTLDLSVRRETFDMKVTAPLANARNTPLKAEGWSGLANMQYIYSLTDKIYVAPTASLIYSKTEINDLPMNQVTMSWRAIESVTGRLGLQIATSFQLTDQISVAPYIGASVWHEFAGKAKSIASIGGDGIFPVSTDRLGTYGQASVGVTIASSSPNISGFVRGDMRFGEKIEGYAINGGLRYQF